MDSIDSFDSKILSSCHINFLFGAGVNGKSFPQLKDFVETNEALKAALGREVENFEDDLNSITQKSKKERVYKKFIEEFKKYERKIDYKHQDIIDIEKMFIEVNRLLVDSENRTKTTKQVNVYTLNYDEIVENVLEKIGVLYNTVSSSNIKSHDKFFNLLGYDYSSMRYIPTYLVSKIHGNIESPVLPGFDKYSEMLAANKFEILFKMKTQLSRMNSVLFVIGYSGKDEHINRILKDCINNGLTIYWFKYDENDCIPEVLANSVSIINQKDNDNKKNMTLICKNMLEKLWDIKSEE